MSTSEHQQLMRHMAWADDEVWRAVLALPAAAADASTRERLHHSHEVQSAYLQIWRGEPPAMRELASFADLAEIRAWGREFHGEAGAYLGDDIFSRTHPARHVRGRQDPLGRHERTGAARSDAAHVREATTQRQVPLIVSIVPDDNGGGAEDNVEASRCDQED